MKKNIFAILFLFLILGSSLTSAWMPKYTHKYMYNVGMESQIDSEIYRACDKYESLCYSGNVLTDVSVLFYYTQFGLYRSTHDPNFARKLIEEARNEQELACAVGNGMHQAQDLISHEKMVPYAIKHSFTVNAIIHIFAEQKVDNWVEDKYPATGAKALNDLNDYETCVPLFKRVMLKDPAYVGYTEEDLDNLFDKFIAEIQNSQTGYDTAFRTKSFFANFSAVPFSILATAIFAMLFFIFLGMVIILRIFKGKATKVHYISLPFILLINFVLLSIFIGNLYGNAFDNVVTLVKPVSNFVLLGNSPEYYVKAGTANTITFLKDGLLFLNNQEPSGYTALANADRFVLLFDYIIFGVVILFTVIWAYALLKKAKIKPSELLQ